MIIKMANEFCLSIIDIMTNGGAIASVQVDMKKKIILGINCIKLNFIIYQVPEILHKDCLNRIQLLN